MIELLSSTLDLDWASPDKRNKTRYIITITRCIPSIDQFSVTHRNIDLTRRTRIDLTISNQCNANQTNHTQNFGRIYAFGTGLDGETFFTGSKNFQVKEIEVFELTDTPVEVTLLQLSDRVSKFESDTLSQFNAQRQWNEQMRMGLNHGRGSFPIFLRG
jgi:hypothetical protein